jgi:hypothetical protein
MVLTSLAANGVAFPIRPDAKIMNKPASAPKRRHVQLMHPTTHSPPHSAHRPRPRLPGDPAPPPQFHARAAQRPGLTDPPTNDPSRSEDCATKRHEILLLTRNQIHPLRQNYPEFSPSKMIIDILPRYTKMNPQYPKQT